MVCPIAGLILPARKVSFLRRIWSLGATVGPLPGMFLAMRCATGPRDMRCSDNPESLDTVPFESKPTFLEMVLGMTVLTCGVMVGPRPAVLPAARPTAAPRGSKYAYDLKVLESLSSDDKTRLFVLAAAVGLLTCEVVAVPAAAVFPVLPPSTEALDIDCPDNSEGVFSGSPELFI